MKNMTTRMICAVLAVIVLVGLTPLSSYAAASDSTAGIVSVSSGNLNVRSGASTSASILKTLPKGAYVTLLSKSGGWWRVEYARGQYGYCSTAYITPVSGAYAAYATGSLNIRTGPGTTHAVKGWLHTGDYVVVLSSSGTWKQVLYGGTLTGYVSGAYLSTGSGSGYSSISLSVPNYKQTDSRWASTKVASSGKTIGQIGCSTVALAMTESYRTGTTIYPNEMTKRLSYTAGGGVYWPSNYAAYTGSDYLSVLYNLLKSGKPTLVGATNAAGGQHWVVVTGFTGGSLSASHFTVNDPGSSSRTTLQQFFAAYPVFYKMMHLR